MANILRDRQAEGNDCEVVADLDQFVFLHGVDGGLSSFFNKHVEALGINQESAILKGHFSVLEQVVEDWQDVALSLFDTIQDQNPALGSSTNTCLVDVVSGASNDLTTLLEITLGNILGQWDIFDFAVSPMV